MVVAGPKDFESGRLEILQEDFLTLRCMSGEFQGGGVRGPDGRMLPIVSLPLPGGGWELTTLLDPCSLLRYRRTLFAFYSLTSVLALLLLLRDTQKNQLIGELKREVREREAAEQARLARESAVPLGGNSADVYGFSLSLSMGDISEIEPGDLPVS